MTSPVTYGSAGVVAGLTKVRAGWYRRGSVNLVSCGGYDLRPGQPNRWRTLDWIATHDDGFARSVAVEGLPVSSSDNRVLYVHNTLRDLRKMLEEV